MRLINITCQNCGNTFQIDADKNQINCGFCGNPLFLNDVSSNSYINDSPSNCSVTVDNISDDHPDSASAQLGKNAGQTLGRISGNLYGSSSKGGYWKSQNNQNNSTNSNNKIWLWVIGWIFIFPIPLTILLLRSDKFNKDWKIGLISGGWLIWLFFMLLVNVGILSSGNSTDGNNVVESSTEETTLENSETKEMPDNDIADDILTNNIKEILTDDSELEVIEGKESKEISVDVDVNDRNSFSYDDIEFVSEDENIATIRYSKTSLTTHIYFIVTGVVPGETYVYAKSKDGEIESEHIKVTVKDDGYPDPESIELVSDVSELAIGETCQLSIVTTPEDATYKNVDWTSSDNGVLKVDENGLVTAVGGGSATITGEVFNDIQASYDINVDASKKLFSVKVNRSRDDKNNIGDEWSCTNYINGEIARSTVSLAVGDTITVSSKYSEDDNNPDVGQGSASHTVTEEDLENGFEITYDLNVTENGGKNSGQSAHFNVTYTFSVK